jgi:pilus assembly protein CpaF
VVQVAEVQGLDGDRVVMQDLFTYEQTGIQNGRVVGALKATGLRPKFFDKFMQNSIELPSGMFETGTSM